MNRPLEDWTRAEINANAEQASVEVNAQLQVWQAHRAQVVEVARAGGKRLMTLRCGSCGPTDGRRADPHAEVIRTSLGIALRTAGQPTEVVDPETGERMTLQEIRSIDPDAVLPLVQVEAWLLDDPTPLPPDVPSIVCKVHGRIQVDVRRLQWALADRRIRRVRVGADGVLTAE